MSQEMDADRAKDKYDQLLPRHTRVQQLAAAQVCVLVCVCVCVCVCLCVSVCLCVCVSVCVCV